MRRWGVEKREVRQVRWGIENLGFKATNAQVGSKLGYIRNSRAKELLLLRSWRLGVAVGAAVVDGAAGGVAVLGCAQDEVVGGAGTDGDGFRWRTVWVRQPSVREVAASVVGEVSSLVPVDVGMGNPIL